ncbi:CD63 antigen [Onthophagus taurus]|uniref:CD63 antigen n=1 Tax=Onthophagus taurus TaxID=166361 RepID=UPI0039BDA735
MNESLPWSGKCVKYLLFSFNLIFFVIGIILISVGVSVKAYYHQYELFLDNQFFSAPNLLIAIGVIIFLIAFFGCCGAIKENYCMIITFSTLMILVFVLQLAAGIAGYALRNSTHSYLEQKLNDSLLSYGGENMENLNTIWDFMQRTFKCCGVNEPGDWSQNQNFNKTIIEVPIPISCCDNKPGAVDEITCRIGEADDMLYTHGCLEGFGDFIRDHAKTIGAVGIGFAFVQLIGIIFACHLSRQLKYNYDNM